MGVNLLLFTFGSLLILIFVDVFSDWYGQFLRKVLPREGLRILMHKLMWVIFCLFFWLHFIFRRVPDNFDVSYLIFAGFIYSIKGLITSLMRKQT